MDKTYLIIHGNDVHNHLRYRYYILNTPFVSGANYKLNSNVNVIVTDEKGKELFFEIVDDIPWQERFSYGQKYIIEDIAESEWIISNLQRLLKEKESEIIDSLKNIVVIDGNTKKMTRPPDPFLGRQLS